ncbi:TIGR04104 family putative zinc finger protein [Sporosarcina sp.]|uniref:TIGR04104 family putative zinc finger protein n=1 Tax=Sporosarcina sp. TaxID=49982 RepID=UPI002618D441|nr:TIGR04104 family putative zinc finger protein [Sporosarcina sp.]
MKKCENCGKQFDWKTTFTSLWRNYTPIACSECGTLHKITPLGRLTFVSMTMFPAVLFGSSFSDNPQYALILAGACFIVLIGSMLAPFAVRYRKAL